jgi:hypothetical protein
MARNPDCAPSGNLPISPSCTPIKRLSNDFLDLVSISTELTTLLEHFSVGQRS